MFGWVFFSCSLSVQQFNITFLFRFQFQNWWNIQTFGLSHNLPTIMCSIIDWPIDKRYSAMKLKVKLNFIDFICLLASFLFFFFSLAILWLWSFNSLIKTNPKLETDFQLDSSFEFSSLWKVAKLHSLAVPPTHIF